MTGRDAADARFHPHLGGLSDDYRRAGTGRTRAGAAPVTGVSVLQVAIAGGMTSTGQVAVRTQYQLTDRCSSSATRGPRPTTSRSAPSALATSIGPDGPRTSFWSTTIRVALSETHNRAAATISASSRRARAPCSAGD